MFELARNWTTRLTGAVLPPLSNNTGWIIDQSAEPSFVEPTLRTIHGDPLTAKAIVVAAPGAVGKSTFARTLGAITSSVLVDLAKAELLGGNFFVGGIANAFGVPALSDAAQGKLGLVIDALDEAQLRAGAEGFAAGLTDLARIVKQPAALPAILFGRSSAAEEAWLVLSDAGIAACLMEIEFFNEQQAREYLEKKLSVVADRRPETKAAYARHPESFLNLAIATRSKLTQTPGGDEPRFAGYAPVLDAVCSYAIENDSLNPQLRLSQLSAEKPVGLIAEIAGAILVREQGKLVAQLSEEVGLDDVDQATLYSPREQLARLASLVIGSPPPLGPSLQRPEVKRAYDRMISDFTPIHPFLDARLAPSNAAFAAYLLVWALMPTSAPAAVRRALAEQPSLGSGLLFDLYVFCLTENYDPGLAGECLPCLDTSDVGLLFGAFKSQAGRDQVASLEVTGEASEKLVEISFDMETTSDAGGNPRQYGPFEVLRDGVIELRGTLANIRISAPVAVTVGDGTAVNITAPVEIDVDVLEINGREVRVFKSTANIPDELQQVALSAEDADIHRVEKVTVLGGRLSVSFPAAQKHPWVDYVFVPPAAPSPEVAVLRRRMRRVLTAFQSRSQGSLRRLAAKIDSARMMKMDNLGPRLINKLQEDGILTTVDAGKFYVLNPERLGPALKMDYQAVHQQKWSPESDEYLGKIAREH